MPMIASVNALGNELSVHALHCPYTNDVCPAVTTGKKGHLPTGGDAVKFGKQAHTRHFAMQICIMWMRVEIS